jgi:hypothetical protein
MSDIITVYFSSSTYNLESVLNALPNPYFVKVFESRTVSKTIEKRNESWRKSGPEFEKEERKNEENEERSKGPNEERIGGKGKTIIEYTEAVLIVDKRDIRSLMYYIRVVPHRNFYPKESQDSKSVYCVFTPLQKKESDRIINLFCKKMGLVAPRFSPSNGFSFYIFETDDYVPQLLGLLNAYPSLDGAKFRYGRKRGYKKPVVVVNETPKDSVEKKNGEKSD